MTEPDEIRAPVRALTPGQERLIPHLIRGLSARQIGRRLRLSPRTVENGIRDIALLIPADSTELRALTPRQRVIAWALARELRRARGEPEPTEDDVEAAPAGE